MGKNGCQNDLVLVFFKIHGWLFGTNFRVQVNKVFNFSLKALSHFCQATNDLGRAFCVTLNFLVLKEKWLSQMHLHVKSIVSVR